MEFELERELTALFWECVSAHCAAVQAAAATRGDDSAQPKEVESRRKKVAATARQKRPLINKSAKKETSRSGDGFSGQSLTMFHFSRVRIFLKEIGERTSAVPKAAGEVVNRIESVCLRLARRARTVPELVTLLADSNLRLLGAEGLLVVEPGGNLVARIGSQIAPCRQQPAEIPPRGSERIGRSAAGRLGSRPKGKRKSINGRMLHAILKNPKAIGWTAVRFAGQLKCAKSSVIATQTWKELQIIRKQKRDD